MYVDFVVPVNVDDKKAYQKEYPFQVIQVPKLSQYPHPPFFLSKEFLRLPALAHLESPEELFSVYTHRLRGGEDCEGKYS